MIQNKYKTIIKDLDNIQNEFTKTELKCYLNIDELFEQLKTVRKKITHFLLYSRQQSNKSCKFTDNKKTLYWVARKNVRNFRMALCNSVDEMNQQKSMYRGM